MDLFSFDQIADSNIGNEVISDSVGDIDTLGGDNNDLPVQGDTTVQRNNSVLQLLGSVGTTARDLGTAAGKIQHDLAAAKSNFSTAQQNAASGNSLATWWQYASTTDKLVVGLAALGILVVVLKD